MPHQVANTRNSIITMWALNPPLVDLLATHLTPSSSHLAQHYPEVSNLWVSGTWVTGMCTENTPISGHRFNRHHKDLLILLGYKISGDNTSLNRAIYSIILVIFNFHFHFRYSTVFYICCIPTRPSTPITLARAPWWWVHPHHLCQPLCHQLSPVGPQEASLAHLLVRTSPPSSAHSPMSIIRYSLPSLHFFVISRLIFTVYPHDNWSWFLKYG